MNGAGDAGTGRGGKPSRLTEAELRELRDAVSTLRLQIDQRWRPQRAAPAEPADAAHAVPAALEADSAAAAWLGSLREYAAEVDWLGLFQELRERMAGFGVESVSADVDDFGLDSQYLDRNRRLLDFLFDRWWRIEVAGTELIPSDERVLFISNRAGILPYDGLMIAQAVERARGEQCRPRFLVADWLFGLPFWQPLLARLGGVRACNENAERLLRSGRWVVAFPEGQKGALKPFRDRYQLQRFGRGGFVSLALRERATIVPVAVVGAEEVHPILYQSDFAERLLGVPVPITPTFPWLGPLGLVPLPSRWRIRFGEPIRLGTGPEHADDPQFVNRLRERVRGTVQELLDQEVRGRSSAF